MWGIEPHKKTKVENHQENILTGKTITPTMMPIIRNNETNILKLIKEITRRILTEYLIFSS